VLERELSVSSLDNELLLDLLEMTDDAGVLSIYVDAGNDRAAAIDVRNRLAELERRIAGNGSPLVADALTRSLTRLEPVLERLLDPRSPGRGRALFVGLTGAEVVSFSSQLRFPNRVVLDSSPFIHPLLEAIDRGRPSGVVIAATDVAELFDWRLGELRRMGRLLSPAREPRNDRPGPVVGNTARARRNTPLREMRERGERRHRARAAETVAAEVLRLADENLWEQILVAGDERVTSAMLHALPDRIRQTVIRDPRHLAGADVTALGRIVAERFEDAHAERTTQLAGHVRDAALVGTGAVGLSEVAAALNEGRVDQLVYDSERRYVGAVDDGGLLYADGEGPSGAAEEPRLTERLVERALTTGAEVTPVPGAAGTVLAEAGGIAARLRW
jgi:hypothetical protein